MAMNLRTPLGSLATASLLALAIVGLPAGSAQAAATNPKNKTASACLAQGYEWDDVKGCADKTCTLHGNTFQPGDVAETDNYDVVVCDGFTGKWVVVSVTPPKPSGPMAPRPRTASTF